MHDNIENEIDSYSSDIDKLKSKTNSVNEQKSPKYSNMSILSAENTNKKEFDNDDKENNQYVNVNITPGAMILTPKAKSVGPTPDRSVSINFLGPQLRGDFLKIYQIIIQCM